MVPVVPVRMTEAWLLIDGAAIARAAGRPGAPVHLPALEDLEHIADPKERLESLLVEAAGDLTGRRRKQFRASLVDKRVAVAGLIADFSPLERLPAFQRVQQDLALCYPYSRSQPAATQEK